MKEKEMCFGIPKWIPEVCPHSKTCRPMGCPIIYQAEKYICDHLDISFKGDMEKYVEAQKKDIIRWNKCRENIPQKTEYKLENFEGFCIFRREILVEEFGESKIETRKQQIIQLLENGDRVGFNEDYGIGTIEKTKKGFTVTKWYYQSESKPVVDGTIEDVINFLFEFWDKPEPFSYSKAMLGTMVGG